MERRKFFTFAAGSAVALLTAAGAQPWDHHDHHPDWHGHDPWHWYDDHGHWHSDHDRYWHEGYEHRHYMDRDFIWGRLRGRGYRRFIGDPYWYQGRYVVRTYDRWGNLIFVEVDPYSGDYIGVVRF